MYERGLGNVPFDEDAWPFTPTGAASHVGARGCPMPADAGSELEREVAQRRKIEAQLARTTARLRRLARHRMQIEEDLRREIARELHDELGQSLTALLVDVQHRARQERDQARWAHVVVGLKRTIGTVRRIAYGLRPPELDALGLARSLESLASTVDRAGRTRVDVSATLRERLPAGRELCLYRVVQEALTNAVQHGGATRVHISLREAQGEVVLSIGDNGKGFDAERVRARECGRVRGGLGLLGMQERMAEFGGTLTVRSVPGVGTRIVARLPLSYESLTGDTGCDATRSPAAAAISHSRRRAATRHWREPHGRRSQPLVSAVRAVPMRDYLGF